MILVSFEWGPESRGRGLLEPTKPDDFDSMGGAQASSQGHGGCPPVIACDNPGCFSNEQVLAGKTPAPEARGSREGWKIPVLRNFYSGECSAGESWTRSKFAEARRLLVVGVMYMARPSC